MVQWTNLQRINRFVNLMRLYISHEKSEVLHLVELGLIAGRQAIQQTQYGQGLKL